MARRAFTFQLYYSKRLRYLHAKIDLAAEIHNHLIAVQIMLRPPRDCVGGGAPV